jgi:transposase-like protein
LAVLLLEEYRVGEVRTISRQILWIFQAQGVHREALAALRLFCEAVERETVTVEMVRRMLDYLRRAQNDPNLRFESD